MGSPRRWRVTSSNRWFATLRSFSFASVTRPTIPALRGGAPCGETSLSRPFDHKSLEGIKRQLNKGLLISYQGNQVVSDIRNLPSFAVPCQYASGAEIYHSALVPLPRIRPRRSGGRSHWFVRENA